MANERNYWVLCDSNCKFPAMTAEQILAAIAEATGNTPQNVNDAFITKIRELNANNALRFWVGTTAEYNAIGIKETDCLYILTDDTAGNDLKTAIADLRAEVQAINETADVLFPKIETLSADVATLKGQKHLALLTDEILHDFPISTESVSGYECLALRIRGDHSHTIFVWLADISVYTGAGWLLDNATAQPVCVNVTVTFRNVKTIENITIETADGGSVAHYVIDSIYGVF